MEEEMNESEVEVTEISLSEDEIEEWIANLQLLKKSKEPISLEIDDETELVVNFDEGEE